MTMEEEKGLVDVNYLLELSGGEPGYMHQVMSIFLENMKKGLANLDKNIRKDEDWDSVSQQAHSLKSGLGIVRIPGILEDLQAMETMALGTGDKSGLAGLLEHIRELFGKAEPEILGMMARYRKG